ncbi:MAG: hypothetical protein VYE77_06430 [Planctomycetota bacterium]|nr:hypothetical protein [Planctomycetota bacterium]
MMNNPLHFLFFSGALVAVEPVAAAQQRPQAEHAVQSVAKVAADEAGCKNHRCGASLGAQFDHADLVFEGIVSRVESRLSDASADGKSPRLPVTFVTFEVLEVFWGMAPVRDPGRITIRLLGGPTPDGRVMEVSGTPLFGVGQRDILMVGQNHRGAASVLHGSNRRFRVRGADVFYESGREVIVSRDGQLLPGALHDIAEFKRVRIGGQVIDRVVRDPNAEQAVPGGASGDCLRLQAEDFRALLRQLARCATPSKYRATKYVTDVSRQDRFVLAKGLRQRGRDLGDAPVPAGERKERDAAKR